MSKMALVTWSSSSSVLMFSNRRSPYSPVLSFTSSREVDISARLSIISCDANLPCLPKTALITSPTSWESFGRVLSCALTCLTASKVDIVPLRIFSCMAATSMPMPCKACLVLPLISRIRAEPCLIASSPWSVKIPDLVCVMMATISSALIPASWKVGASC